MALSVWQSGCSLRQLPMVDTAELVDTLRARHPRRPTAYRPACWLTRFVGCVSQGNVHLPLSRWCYLTAHGLGETTGMVAFETPLSFIRASPESGECLGWTSLSFGSRRTLVHLAELRKL